MTEITIVDTPGTGVIDYRITWLGTVPVIGVSGWSWVNYMGYAWELETEEVVNP
jgi:hypothetical protein